MASTTQISVGSGAAVPVTVVSVCREVRVMENKGVASWPTTDYLVMKPPNGTAPSLGASARIPAGSSYTFKRPTSHFHPGDIIGYLQTIAGTTTFDQDEDSS